MGRGNIYTKKRHEDERVLSLHIDPPVYTTRSTEYTTVIGCRVQFGHWESGTLYLRMERLTSDTHLNYKYHRLPILTIHTAILSSDRRVIQSNQSNHQANRIVVTYLPNHFGQI